MFHYFFFFSVCCCRCCVWWVTAHPSSSRINLAKKKTEENIFPEKSDFTSNISESGYKRIESSAVVLPHNSTELKLMYRKTKKNMLVIVCLLYPNTQPTTYLYSTLQRKHKSVWLKARPFCYVNFLRLVLNCSVDAIHVVTLLVWMMIQKHSMLPQNTYVYSP